MVDKSRDTRYDICPSCGRYKRKISVHCKRCSGGILNQTNTISGDIKWELLTPEWIAEFRGLFWGEGSAMIVSNGPSYCCVLTLVLAEKDRQVIEDIQQRLGGTILFQRRTGRATNPNHSPIYRWRIAKQVQVAEICQLLLVGSLIPAAKRHDVAQVLDFIEWRASLPHFLSEEHKQEMAQRCKQLRESRLLKSDLTTLDS